MGCQLPPKTQHGPVAADDQRELRSYVYNPTTRLYDKTVLGPIKKGTITWNMTAGSF